MDILERLPSSGAIALIAEFTARPGRGDDVDALLAGLARNVRAEPGNIAFNCHRLLEDRSKFVVYEIYKDRSDFEAHISADYGAVFNAKLGDMIEEPNSILTFLTPLIADVQ